MEPWVIFLIIVMFVMMGKRRRRWERWQERQMRSAPGERAGRIADPERDALIESLETRVAHLEERLDFTERLLQGRSERAREE